MHYNAIYLHIFRLEESKRKGDNNILKIAEVCDWCGLTFGLDYQCRKNLGDRRELCMMAYYGDKNGAYKRSARMKRKFNDILKVAEVCDWCGATFNVEYECRKDLGNKQTLCMMAYYGDKNGAYKRSFVKE